MGVLNYLFTDKYVNEHFDAIIYLKKDKSNRKHFYTISNIKDTLDKIDEELFFQFLEILVFDALVGEIDRHEENWGIDISDGKYIISPLYDNGCSLLNEFRNESFAQEFYDNKKSFDAYIKRSKCQIYKENNQQKYRHFDLINDLNGKFPEKIQLELNRLKKLNDKTIEDIVNKIPNQLLTRKHRDYIIDYVKKRRDFLLAINKKEE